MAITPPAGGGYTHREWRTTMNDLIDVIDKGAGGALEQMAGLAGARHGGAAHMAEIGAAQMALRDVVTSGRYLVSAEDTITGLVAQAQAAAGGVSEVARDKNYNIRD